MVMSKMNSESFETIRRELELRGAKTKILEEWLYFKIQLV